MSESKSKSTGISFSGALTIAFIVLKLCNKVNWSWWWVLCPLWAPLGLLIVGFLIYLPFKVWKARDERNRIKSGYNQYGWNKEGRSKWQQRLEQMQEALKKEK